MNNAYEPIPKEKFTLVQMDTSIFDVKHQTKPIGYFKDAWIRFRKNKASVVAASIILCLLLFGIITMFASDYKITDVNGMYKKARPKIASMDRSGYWDGGMKQTVNERFYILYAAMAMGEADWDGHGATWEEGMAAEHNPIISESAPYENSGSILRDIRVDTYYNVGFEYLSVTKDEFARIEAWQEETGIRVLYPMVDTQSQYMDVFNQSDADMWYRHDARQNPLDENGKRMTVEQVMENGLVDIYLRDSSGNVRYYEPQDKTMVKIRVLFYTYSIFKDGREPIHALGADGLGYDIMVRMASGLLLSIALALCVAAVNLTIGAFYGAIQGYYGGWIDIFMDRICDIIGGLPFIILATLVQLHLVAKGKLSAFAGILFAYVLQGWLGTAHRVRTQFYRFKNQEYILAARTLGAKDFRLMFKHIFPNALGTIITGSVLVIPGVIFGESMLAFLGIVNLGGRNGTSLGSMLNEARQFLSTDPHIMFFPALTISLMMISFNLFGNGLRDAFNPSLRGVEE